MRSYFEHVGDKRPDKDGIYLPTCLTEKAIFSVMVEELYGGDSSKSMSFSHSSTGCFDLTFLTSPFQRYVPVIHL